MEELLINIINRVRHENKSPHLSLHPQNSSCEVYNLNGFYFSESATSLFKPQAKWRTFFE